ncbi:unnamed protein product, partial [Dibothriocephalus latus]
GGGPPPPPSHQYARDPAVGVPPPPTPPGYGTMGWRPQGGTPPRAPFPSNSSYSQRMPPVGEYRPLLNNLLCRFHVPSSVVS